MVNDVNVHKLVTRRSNFVRWADKKKISFSCSYEE